MRRSTIISKIKNLFISYLRLFGLYILFFICVALLQNIFPDLDLKKYSQGGVFEILRENKLKAFLVMIIFAPFIEELMFRTLIKPTNKDLLLFLSSWTLFFLGLFITLELAWYYRYIIFLVTLFAIFIIYERLIAKDHLKKTIRFLEKYKSITLQVTAVIFGFLHIFNYVDSFKFESILFLLIFPRIIAGHMFGKIKIENGHIVWPMLLHAINNGVVFLIINNRL